MIDLSVMDLLITVLCIMAKYRAKSKCLTEDWLNKS